MEGNLLKMDRFTAEYQFAKDLVEAVIEIRTIYVPDVCNLQLDNMFFTVERRNKVRELFSKEWSRLDEYVRRFTSRDGRSDYGDRQFLLCVVQFMEEYKPELKSEEEFLLVCSRIAYVAACFLRNNDQSDAISVAVDRVYEILIDTFYATTINEDGPLIKDIRDHKYRFAYDLVKTLIEMRGIHVPELELSNSENGLFTAKHKNEVKELFFKEWLVLDRQLNSFTCIDGTFDYSDENFSRCVDKIVEDYGSEQNTEEEFLLVCVRIACAAAWFIRKNSKSNAIDLAVDIIHQMVKKTIYFNKYEQDDDYRFACDLVKAIFEMRSNPLSDSEMSHSSSCFFMIAHRNKIEDVISRELPNLDEVVRKVTSKGGSLDYNDNQFVLCMNQITDYYKPEYKSKEEIVHACAKMSYVAACFLRKNKKSNAPELALDRMLEIVKDVSRFPNSKDEEVLIMHTHDDHFRFAYDLVKTVLKMKRIPISDLDLPDPDHFLFTDSHRKEIEDLLSKESSQLDKAVEKVTNGYGLSDYSDSNFLRCMYEIIKGYHYDQTTEEGLVHISAIIAYLSACFSKENCESNAAFLTVNRIYEMVKEVNCFSSSTEERVLIVKPQDDHYQFAYDLAKTVFEIKGIPVSPIDLPDPVNILFTDAYREIVKDLLSKEWSQLDEMVEKLTNKVGRLDYSDNKFLHCMNQIVQDYKSEQTNEGFVYICARIAYIAACFLINNYKSNATFLAVNRMYEMSKDAFPKKMEDACVQNENYQFSYDLVRAALRMRNNSSFKVEMSDPGDSPLTIAHKIQMQELLSKEWPRLHQLVRRFTRTCAGIAFSDGHFLHCMQQIINDYEPEQKSEEGLLLVSARIAYVATCFLRNNQKSNAVYLALDRIYQMRKKFYRFRNTTEAKSLAVDVRDYKYRFAYDLVRTVMELKGTPVPVAELPDPDNFLFTSRYRTKIKKLLRRDSNINKLVQKLTNRDGNLDYSDGTFQRCMDKIFEDYKYEQANKGGFVRLCARIAYPASYFVRKNNASNATTLAIGRIHEMVTNIGYFNEDLEDNKLMGDVKDDKYRFAYDLVKTVVEMQGKALPNVEFPDPGNFLFTAEHKHKMEEFFPKEGPQLADLMKRFTCKDGNEDYSDKSFVECMDQIIKDYKPERYTEEGFILLCCRIAYVASFYFKKISSSNATLLAINRIHAMIKDVFSRGTLSQSSW
ncbi:hypothetical protein AVEN_70249-1 [Araneus ventricosus]|uniref:Uncharacterized protein n=1 Tax=Araneus ventricosus TaxID=182803 RepID=A0A4Y2GCW4_ARAVE|nr:hypothetical protein AVEN_70249-1 [Araneus ventricosus]